MMYKTIPAPVRSSDMLPTNKTLHDLSMLDNADMTTALRIALSVMTLDQKNTVISSEITTCGVTRTARVTLSELIEQAIYNQIVGE